MKQCLLSRLNKEENPAFLNVQLRPDSPQTYRARITNIDPLAIHEQGVQYLIFSVIASEELLAGLQIRSFDR